MGNRSRVNQSEMIKTLEARLLYACKLLAIIADEAGGEIRIPPTVMETEREGQLLTSVDPVTTETVIAFKHKDIVNADLENKNNGNKA